MSVLFPVVRVEVLRMGKFEKLVKESKSVLMISQFPSRNSPQVLENLEFIHAWKTTAVITNDSADQP